MNRIFLLTSAWIGMCAGAQAADPPLHVLTWGGDFTAAQEAAFGHPFEEKTGIHVNFIDSDDPPTPLKAQVEAKNVTTDLASVSGADALRFCDEGIVEPIDPARLAPAPDGTPAAQDFLPGALGECFVATDIYATVMAFDRSKFAGQVPEKAADFFDIKSFPGRRGLGKTPEFTMEFALLADGVPADQVYATLATPEGVTRALAKLDTIRDQIVWWQSGAQAMQLLADGEVAMTHAYNGRVFKAATQDAKPFEIVWDGQLYEIEGWVIPKGAPNAKAAWDFLTFSTAPEALARAAEQLPYGPPRRSAQGLVGAFAGDGKTRMEPHLPTAAANSANALAVDPAFWADHEAELRERFNAWLVAG